MHPNVVATLEQAARLAQLDPAEICWACEEFGRCDTDGFTIFPADDGDHFIVRPTR